MKPRDSSQPIVSHYALTCAARVAETPCEAVPPCLETQGAAVSEISTDCSAVLEAPHRFGGYVELAEESAAEVEPRFNLRNARGVPYRPFGTPGTAFPTGTTDN